MTPEQVFDLLTLIAARDRRTVGKVDVAVWLDDIGDLPFDDCREAVRIHFAEQPGTWLMAGHIRAIVRRLRDDRLGPAGPGLAPIPPPASPDDVPGYLAALRNQNRAIGDGRQPRPELPAGEPGSPADNEHVRAILAAFEAERQAKRDREQAERDRERRAIRAYAAAQERLLALPEERRLELVKLAEGHLLNSEQAMDGFPLLDEIPGNGDREKVVVLAARLADRETS